MDLRLLNVEQVLDWVDAAFQRTGEWPNQFSGPITESPGDTWAGINYALNAGRRGLPGGCSLAQLLSDQRGIRNRGNLVKLSTEQILIWADAYHQVMVSGQSRTLGDSRDTRGDLGKRPLRPFQWPAWPPRGANAC